MNPDVTVDLADEEATKQFAIKIASGLTPPFTFGLSGEIGMGKTTLIRALLKHLGVKSTVKSPTYSLIESYEVGNFKINHFDLYRIQDESELDYIGFRDYFVENAVCCIEWPEHAESYLKKCDVLFIFHLKDNGRQIKMYPKSNKGLKFLSCMALNQ